MNGTTTPHAGLAAIFDLYDRGAPALEGKNEYQLRSLIRTLLGAYHSLFNVATKAQIDGYRFSDGRPISGVDKDGQIVTGENCNLQSKCDYLSGKVLPSCLRSAAVYLSKFYDEPQQGQTDDYFLNQVLHHRLSA